MLPNEAFLRLAAHLPRCLCARRGRPYRTVLQVNELHTSASNDKCTNYVEIRSQISSDSRDLLRLLWGPWALFEESWQLGVGLTTNYFHQRLKCSPSWQETIRNIMRIPIKRTQKRLFVQAFREEWISRTSFRLFLRDLQCLQKACTDFLSLSRHFCQR